MVQKAEYLEINSKNNDLRTINIYDNQGKLIATRHENATNKVVIPVGLFRKGVYIVQSQNITLKFRIQ